MSESPEIDFTKIDFPSDELTIKTIRRLSPDHFDSEPEACGKLFDDTDAGNPMIKVTDLLDAERFVAEGAFLKANGVQCDPVYLKDQQRCAEDAAELYVHFGLASGPLHAQQLIRGIESQAAEQARQHPGSGPKPSPRGRV